MKTLANKRTMALLPEGIPRYVRCYDSGPDGSFDRYTVVYTGMQGGTYVGMSKHPYHPQGFCQHGEGRIDRVQHNKFLWPPAVGRKNHLGRRIKFQDLPFDCRNVVLNDYLTMWAIDQQDLAMQWVNSHLPKGDKPHYATG